MLGPVNRWFGFQRTVYQNPLLKTDGFLLKQTSAYAAVRVVDGTYYWDTTKNANMGKWLICENEYTPVILEVAEKSKYQSFGDFREAIKKQAVAFQRNTLKYKGLYGDSFVFFADHSQSPTINDVTVDYAPDRAFDSPFLQSVWNSGIVTIKKGERELQLDFNN